MSQTWAKELTNLRGKKERSTNTKADPLTPEVRDDVANTTWRSNGSRITYKKETSRCIMSRQVSRWLTFLQRTYLPKEIHQMYKKCPQSGRHSSNNRSEWGGFLRECMMDTQHIPFLEGEYVLIHFIYSLQLPVLRAHIHTYRYYHRRVNDTHVRIYSSDHRTMYFTCLPPSPYRRYGHV